MKYVKLAFCSVAFLGIFSCQKVIDVKDDNFIPADQAFKTVAQTEQGIVGAYAALGIEMDILLNATLSDEVKVAEFYNAATTHEWQYTSTDIGIRDNFTASTPLYRVIDRVNRVLQALPTITGDSATKAKLRGEGLFLRAFCHFNLYRYYSGDTDPNALAMAYMEVPSPTPFTVYPRITVAPYFQKLKADMAEAKTLVPNSLADLYRVNRLTISGLQARVALYLKEWNDAITYSTEYITALPLASRANFPGIWTDTKTDEVSFRLRRTSSIGAKIGSLFRGTSASSASIGTVTWRPSDKIWGSYDQANDIRFSSYFKDEPLLTSAGRGSRLISKYAGGAYGTSAENVADAKVVRTGEMYLIRAEAKAETNDLIGSAVDLNALRAARNLNYVTAVFASKQALIDATIDERFKELAYEGHRFWDLRRRNLPVQRLASDAPSVTGTTLAAGNFRFRLPIPNTEIQANPSIQQNPGYAN